MVENAQRLPVSLAPGACWRTAPLCARYALRVDLAAATAAAAPVVPIATLACHSLIQGDWAALWLGPDEQLLIGPDDAGVAFAAAVSSALRDVPHSLVDVGQRQGALEVTGPNAASLINAGCPLDLGLEQFQVGYCTRTVMAKAEIVLWRRGNEQFRLEMWRSFMPYVAGLLARVEQEF